MYRIEGMGLVGSAVAWLLHQTGRTFTWYDNGSAHCAWPCSTGAIFPDDDERGVAGHRRWTDWMNRPATSPLMEIIQAGLVERADYWYCTKSAPHGVKVQAVDSRGVMKLHPTNSFHLNVQRFVEVSRNVFHRFRSETLETDGTIIRAHGFGPRLKRVVWGWTGMATIEAPELLAAGRMARPCVYLRQGRFRMAYLYPVPKTPYWYAGSSLIAQAEPHSLAIEPKAARWRRDIEDLSGGSIKVLSVTQLTEGWRPSTGKVSAEAGQPFWAPDPDGALAVMPMWHSGVRWLPLVLEALNAQLKQL